MAIVLGVQVVGRTVRLLPVGLTAGTGATYSISRSWDGMSAPVRGAVGSPITGSHDAVTDHEAPFGTPITYTLTAYDAAGAVTERVVGDPGSVTVVSADSVISDPLDPGNSTTIKFLAGALASQTYSRPGVVSQAIGGRLPVASVGTRAGAAGVPLDVHVMSRHEFDAVMRVLHNADPVCLRLAADEDRYWMLPRMAYVSAQDIIVEPVGAPMGQHLALIRWTVAVVRGPSTPILVPTRTYADVAGEAATYGDLKALYAQYVNLKLGV